MTPQPASGASARRRGVPEGRRLSAVAAAYAACLSSVGPASAMDLARAIELAYRHNPTIEAQRSSLRILDEAYVRARSALGVNVAANVEVDSQAATVDQPGSLFSLPSTERAHAVTDSESLTVIQPLYEGGQSASAIAAARFGVLLGRQQLQKAESDLVQQTVAVYDDVVRDRAIVDIYRSTVEQLEGELRETSARFKEHEVTFTDLNQAKARMEAAKANLSLVQARLDSSIASFVQVVGENPGELQNAPDLPRLPASVSAAFDLAERESPAILAAQYNEESSHALVAEARAANNATVNLRFDYLHAPVTSYSSQFFQQSFTARLMVNKPLYSSGSDTSRLREALERDNRDRLGIEGARRDAIQAVAQAWSQLTATTSALDALNRQEQFAQIAYDSVRKELKAGLRTTIEVLNAEQELQSARVQTVSARHDRHVAQAAVLAAIGALDAKLLAPELRTYRPEMSLRAAERSLPPWVGAIEAIDGLGQPTVRKRPLAVEGGGKRPATSPPPPP